MSVMKHSSMAGMDQNTVRSVTKRKRGDNLKCFPFVSVW